MKLTIFVMLLGFVFIFAGFANGSGENDSKEADPMEETMEMSAEDSDGMMAIGGWVHFTTLEDARMTAAKSPALLFFNASWCPSCRTAVADIASRSSELGEITVILVDYDSEKELKRQYNVTSQHTYVQIDEDGEAVTAWNGGGVDQILNAVVEMEKS
jgi:thiol-disulfide isomerase/thioredoxin